MATAGSIITRALRLLGALGEGQTPSATQYTDGLEVLNAMVDSWRNERLMVYQLQKESVSWVSGASKTIGAGGDWNTTRPVRIEAAFVRDAMGNDYPMQVLRDRTEYDAIILKTTTSNLPSWLFYDPAYPLGTIYLYPVPSASVTIYIDTWAVLSGFSSTSDSISLPPGYERALAYNLAVDWAPEFGEAQPNVIQLAASSKRGVKSINNPQLIAQTELGYVNRSGKFNINTGGYGPNPGFYG